MEKTFKFEMSQVVVVEESGETGKVIARAEYLDGAPQYYVRYKSGDGRAVQTWWDENALKAA